jgi:transcriptional regulator with XRE-family HTH domain
MSRNTINNLKGGSIPSVDKIASIADYFDVSIDYLLGREESPVRVNGHVNGDNSVQNITDSPVTTIQEPPKQIIADGLTNEFIQVFQGLSFPDKMEVMNLTMQKGA